MALVEFENGTQPYLNASNLNNNFNELSSYSKYKAEDWFSFDYDLNGRIWGYTSTKFLNIRIPINKILDDNLQVQISNINIDSLKICQQGLSDLTYGPNDISVSSYGITTHKTAVELALIITNNFSDLVLNTNAIVRISGSIKFTSTNS